MWLSKLNEMSIGPLWVLRNQARSQPAVPAAVCPVCSQAWLESAGAESQVMVVLDRPLTDAVQQTLLQNCLRAAGWNDAAVFNLHSACASHADAAALALQTQLAVSVERTLIVFGEAVAQRLNAEFRRGQVHRFHDARLVVTYHPEQMIDSPSRKAQVWADLCLAAHEA